MVIFSCCIDARWLFVELLSQLIVHWLRAKENQIIIIKYQGIIFLRYVYFKMTTTIVSLGVTKYTLFHTSAHPLNTCRLDPRTYTTILSSIFMYNIGMCIWIYVYLIFVPSHVRLLILTLRTALPYGLTPMEWNSYIDCTRPYQRFSLWHVITISSPYLW